MTPRRIPVGAGGRVRIVSERSERGLDHAIVELGEQARDLAADLS